MSDTTKPKKSKPRPTATLAARLQAIARDVAIKVAAVPTDDVVTVAAVERLLHGTIIVALRARTKIAEAVARQKTNQPSPSPANTQTKRDGTK